MTFLATLTIPIGALYFVSLGLIIARAAQASRISRERFTEALRESNGGG